MPQFNVPGNVTVEDFFEKHVTGQFQEMIAGADLSAMQGKEFTLQFNVDEKKYCIIIKDGKTFNVVKGGIEKPLLTICVNESLWRDSITGKLEGIMDMFTDPAQLADIRRYNTLSETKGTMKVDLKKDDGSSAEIALIFNGAASPVVTINLAVSDWVAMQKKETDGQNLVMAGKMQFDGDMMFLMQLQNLM